ncbi:MAG TPA: type II toxin-antitoxin system prevent-host-death family antitoxin [Bryobacteraceae bacterium]|nr:type II toxin-antitoxin system prevent-host-death family antitoxin [Bryobacteraceae bacterium]
MASVQIADLKNNLSAYLRKVRTGEEVIICDRKSPIAKIVPLSTVDFDLEEQELIAKGRMLPPRKPFDADAFFAIGKGIRIPRVSRAAIRRALDFTREDVNVSLLGRKRPRKTVRTRSIKPAR